MDVARLRAAATGGKSRSGFATRCAGSGHTEDHDEQAKPAQRRGQRASVSGARHPPIKAAGGQHGERVFGMKRARGGPVPDQRPPLRNQGAIDGAMPAGALRSTGEAALRPPESRQRDGAVHRELTRVGVRRCARQRLGVDSR